MEKGPALARVSAELGTTGGAAVSADGSGVDVGDAGAESRDWGSRERASVDELGDGGAG